MIDINIVREKPEIIKNSLKNRQMSPSVVDQLADLDKNWRAVLTKAEVLKAERNVVSKLISKTTDKSDKDRKIAEMRVVGEKITALAVEIKEMEKSLNDLIATIPNILDESVPLGKNETKNNNCISAVNGNINAKRTNNPSRICTNLSGVTNRQRWRVFCFTKYF